MPPFRVSTALKDFAALHNPDLILSDWRCKCGRLNLLSARCYRDAA